MAAAVAKAPHHRLPTPFVLMRCLSKVVPLAPCTWSVVLRVSTGVRIMRKPAALEVVQVRWFMEEEK